MPQTDNPENRDEGPFSYFGESVLQCAVLSFQIRIMGRQSVTLPAFNLFETDK